MDFALKTAADYNDEENYRRELLKRLFDGEVYLRWDEEKKGMGTQRTFHADGERKVGVGSMLQALRRTRDGEVDADIRAGKFMDSLRALKDRAQQLFGARSAPPVNYIDAALSYWADRLDDKTISEAYQQALKEGKFSN